MLGVSNIQPADESQPALRASCDPEEPHPEFGVPGRKLSAGPAPKELIASLPALLQNTQVEWQH